MRFLILCFLLSQGLLAEEIHLKSGATLIYSQDQWNSPTSIVAVFLRGGSTLRYERRSGFPALAQEFLTSRINNVAKKNGFRYKTFLSWDYLAYVFYLTPELLEKDPKKLWSVVFSEHENNGIDLQNLKNKLSYSINKESKQKFIRYPIISLMVPYRNIYSLGLYGSEEDVSSITMSDLNAFLSCYSNPSNAVIVISGVKDINSVVRALEGYKPCSMSGKFIDDNKATFELPQKELHFVKSWKKSTVVRLGFKSSKCNSRLSVVYDIVADLIKRAPKGINVFNDCYATNGVMEMVLNVEPGNEDDAVADVLKRISALSVSIDEKDLNKARQDLQNDYWQAVNNRENFVYLSGKAAIYAKGQSALFEYLEELGKVDLLEVKDAMKVFDQGNMCRITIKMED